MRSRGFLATSLVIFLLVALAHLIRIVGGIPVTVDAVDVPMWISWAGLIVPAAMAAWACRLLSGPKPPG